MEEMTVVIPSGWDEVTVMQYQQIQLLDPTKYESNIQYLIDVIAVLGDVDTEVISGINLGNLNVLAAEMDWIGSKIPQEKKETVVIGEDTYYWVGPFNSLAVGEMISIEQIIDLEDLTYTMAIDVVLAVLLRKKVDGKLEKFDSKAFAKTRDMFSKIPIVDVYGMIVFFSTGGNNSTSHLEVCSSRTMKKMKKNLLLKSWKFVMKWLRQVFRRGGSGSV